MPAMPARNKEAPGGGPGLPSCQGLTTTHDECGCTIPQPCSEEHPLVLASVGFTPAFPTVEDAARALGCMIGSEWVLYWPVGALPYGVGTRQDGRVTLLNWFGEPIWDRWPDGRVTRADRDETGIEFVSEETFD